MTNETDAEQLRRHAVEIARAFLSGIGDGARESGNESGASAVEMVQRLISDLRVENARLRAAMSVPAVWSSEECDGMEEAYRRASERHGHYESLFATVAWVLRERAKALESTP